MLALLSLQSVPALCRAAGSEAPEQIEDAEELLYPSPSASGYPVRYCHADEDESLQSTFNEVNADFLRKPVPEEVYCVLFAG